MVQSDSQTGTSELSDKYTDVVTLPARLDTYRQIETDVATFMVTLEISIQIYTDIITLLAKFYKQIKKIIVSTKQTYTLHRQTLSI